MTNMLVTDSLNRIVGIEEIKNRLASIDIRDALAHITKLASRQLWFPEIDEIVSKVNLVNLSHLAKAVVLYASPNGRPLDLGKTDSNDLVWLLKAINSLQWYPRNEVEQDLDAALISMLMRQAYVRNFVGDHPVNAIARAYTMFYERISRVDMRQIDLDASLHQIIGVNCRDLWILCSAIYMFYFLECPQDGGAWMFRPDFFADAPQRHGLEATLRRVLNAIARTPEEIRNLYRTNSKYHSGLLPDEYWLSEFNILRDFPIVQLGEDQFCCPFPIFAWMRGSVGYYFDLVTHHANIEREVNPKNRNPFDNVMGQILGDVFQDYVGLQLAGLAEGPRYLLSEFEYQNGPNTLDSPDWVLQRIPELSVLFECKARRPSLAMQTRCNASDREAEIRSVISRALGQLTVFLRNAVAGRTSQFVFTNNSRVIYALVLYESFPFHALPDIRDEIERLALTLDPDWAHFRERVFFVPLSIQELELACLIERKRGLLFEDQLNEYARYRRCAPRHRNGICAQHFYDYAVERWPLNSVAIPEASLATWERFCEMMYHTIYGEGLAEYEARLRSRWIAEAAYFRWLNAGCERSDHVENWLQSERDFESLSLRLGMPPYQENRLKMHRQICSQFG